MCIVITKEKYVSMPSNNTMRRCWESNPQGAGYMYTDPTTRQVFGKKGFMKLDDLLKELANPKLEKMNVVIHFRIATHGGVNSAATHPFPVSDKVDDLNALEWTSKAGVAHNGIIPSYGTQKGLSDTQEFIKNVLSKAGEHVLHPGVLKMTEAMIGSSRLAIMRRDRIVRIGNGWVKFKGCWYSNSGYRKIVYAPVFAKKYGFEEDLPYTGRTNQWDKLDKRWDKNTYWDSKWSGMNMPKTTEKEVVTSRLADIQNIPIYEKPVEPIQPDAAGYVNLDLEDDSIGSVAFRPTWCKGRCLSDCSYYENGTCIIHEEMMEG